MCEAGGAIVIDWGEILISPSIDDGPLDHPTGMGT
jgi:hypothetical protein